VGAKDASVAAGGLFRPFALAGGRAVATWTMKEGRLALEPFGRITRAIREALEADALGVARFFAQDEGRRVV
jgi:hypothetical protein